MIWKAQRIQKIKHVNQMFRGSNFKAFQNSFDLKVIIVISSLHLIFIVIFDKVTAFAPDEANYIGVFNNLYRSDFSLDGYLGWQEGTITGLRLIYLPGKLLEIIGFSDFYAVRILSVLYSMLSLFLVLKMAPDRKLIGLPVGIWIAMAFSMPSVFLWTSLGLRESFIIFSLISIFYSLVNPGNLLFRTRFITLAAASSFFLISKIYLFGLLLICLVISILILKMTRQENNRRDFILISAFIIPLLIFPSLVTNTAIVAKGTIDMKLNSSSTMAIPTTAPPRGQMLHDLVGQLDENPILSKFSKVTGIQPKLEESVDNSYLVVNSSKLTKSIAQLQTQPASLKEPLSLLIGAYHFLFIPAPFVDNGSFFLNLHSYESFLWYLFYIIMIHLLIGLLSGRYFLNLATVSSTLFTLSFILMSALVETNDGTSVRHRVVLLMGILIMLSTFRSKESSHP